MATSYLDAINRLYEIERGRTATNGAAAYTAGAATVAPVSAGAQSVKNTKKNKLGPLGGIGYLGEKFGAGVMQSIEGIWDFVAGGIADLDWVGQHKWAEKQVANDWFDDWYDTAGSWYNAGGGWQLAGDVSQGIGTSAVSIASAFIPYVGPGVAIGTAAASGGGSGVREAYKESGKLSDDEWKYGTMVGATEGVLEAATNAIGAGSGALIKTFSKTASKNLAKGATKVAKKAVYESGKKALAKSFAGEAFEEGMATFLSPYYARMTYNPNAENATGQEIAYSALVGGLAGVVMGGADVGIKMLGARNAGAKIYEKGAESSALNAADFILEEESRDPLGSAYTVELSKLRHQLDEHLSATNGAYDNKAKTLLGKINVVSTAAASERALNASAVHIALNADQVAQALNDLNYTDGNGNKITYTADQLREGIEFKDGKPTKKSINRALKNNVVLRELVTRDAAGHLLMDTDVFAESAMQGRFALNEQELGDFIYKASDAKKRELGKALGIEDWNAVDVNQVNDRIAEFMDNGGDMWYARREEQMGSFEARRGSRKTRLANASDYSRKRDGIGHYEIDGNEIGIEKDGDTYTLYDYDNKTISKDLTENELRSALAEYDSKRENAKRSAENVEQASEQAEAAKNPESKPSTLSAMDEYAREKVVGFSRLNPANKATVRRILRQGRALGVKESVLLDFANVAARAKIDVVFDKEATKVAWKNKDGDIVESYGNAFYDPHGVRIVANPEAQTSDVVLIHELDHALRKSVKDGKLTTKTFKKAIEAVPKEEAQKIAKRYTGKDGSDAANATSESNKNAAIEAGKITLARMKDMNPARTNTEAVASVLLAPDVINAVIEAKNGDNELNAAEKEKYADELNAYYAQTVLGEKDVIKYLVAEKPALKEKILSFFKKASNDYSGAPNLQRQAMKYYKQYRKWFNEFAENRQGAQMGSAVVKTDAKDLAYSFSSIAHTPSSKNIAWRNVAYGDAETKANITSDTHKKMVEDGLIVKIPDETASKVKKSYPDLQGMSKKERLPILKESIKQLKNNLRAFLVQLKGKSFEFEVEGDVLEAKLYNAGIDEVLEKITQDKAEMLYTTEEIFRNSRYLYSTPDYSGDANIYRWNYFYTPVQIGDNIVGVRIAIRDMAKQGDSQIYNWGIKKDTSLGGVRDDHTNRKSNDASSDASSKDSISQPMDSVNDGDKKTSKIAKDSLGNELTEAQAEYFKDSKERDKDGNLRVMYQGAAEDFSVFDRKKSKPSNLYGRGFYFTDSVTNANLYGSARAFYLNITNPLSTDKRTITRIQMRKFLNAVAKNEDYGIENYGTSDVGEVLASVYSGKNDFAMIQDVNATCIGDLVAAVELFNEVNGTSYDGFILPTESVTFKSAQAKLTSNKAPTLDPNISYSLPDNMDSEYMTAVNRGDMETAQKMVDEAAKAAGYTQKAFHGTKSSNFYVFDKNRIGDNYGGYNAEGGAFDFTYDESRAWLWAGKAKGFGKPRVISAYIKAEKPFYAYNGEVAKELFELLPSDISDEEKQYAMANGVSFKEVLENHGIDFKKAVMSKGIDSYKLYRGDFGNIGVYSPFQIKSTDPVTYDDNGNVIPLSKRFDPRNPDIRYSLPDNLSDDALTVDDLIAEIGGDDLEALVAYATDHGSFYSSSIDDISEETKVEPEKIKILIHRLGLANTYVDDKHRAVMKQRRLDEAIKDSGSTNPTYAKRYITEISTKDFIDLTVFQKHKDREAFDTEVRGDYGGTMSDYDYKAALKDSNTPYMEVELTTGRVTGHNGRHRIRALEMAGIKSVEIELELYEDGDLVKYGAKTIPDLAISSQFDTAIETHLYNVIPLNESHRTEIERIYGVKAHSDAGVSYSLPDVDENGNKIDYGRLDTKSAKRYNEKNNKQGALGNEQRSENAEILAQSGHVQGAYRGRDGVREQSADSERVFRRLENAQNSKGRDGEIWAGHSGWLGEQRLRRGAGFLREIRGLKLKETDSAGRPLSIELRKSLSNTVFKDEDGTILSLYHWTNAAFDDFKKSSDIGFHFGTLDAANRRREGKEAVGRGTTTMFKEVYLNIKNPVIIDFDPGRWSVFTSSYKANQYGALSDKQLNELKSMEGYHRGSYDSPAAIELRRMLEENGYDGILYTNAFEGGFSVIAFHPEQIITVAENGVDVKKAHRGADVAFSLPDTDADGNPIDYSKIVDQGVPYAKMPEINETVGKMRQHIANAEHYKVFSKHRILKDIRQMSVGDLLKEDTRKKIADSVWQSFNSFKHAWEAESYIKDMSRYILSAAMREGKTARAIPEEAQRRFDSMYPYIRRMTFTERELEDIRAARGDDGYKSLLGRWGYKETKADASGKHKKTHSTPMDVFVTDIAREVEDFKSLEDMNPVDAFLALDDAYTEAKKDLAEKWQPALEDATDADLEAILNYIEIDLRTAYQDLGDKSAFMRDLEPRLQAAKERADRWKAEYDKTNRYARYSRIVEDKARQIRDLKRHKFHNATQAVNDTLYQSIGSLSNAIHRGVISVSKVRKACAELALLYKSEDFRKNILLYEGENEPGLYNGAVETYLQILADGDHKALQHLNLFDEIEEEYRQSVNASKGFSAHELVLLDKVLSYFINFYKSYGKVFHRGTRVDLSTLAVEMVNIQQENASLRENVMLRTVAGKWYSRTFLDPMSNMRMADGYVENGFNTTMMEDLREGKIKAMFEEMRIMKQYDEFMKKHEKYFRKASENSVNVRGRYITKIKLIDLYLTTFRKQAWEGLAINGYQYTDTEGNTVRVDGELDAHQVYEGQEVEDAVLRLRGEIEQHLSATDREYIALVEHIFNVESKRLKYNRDVERFGFSNVEDGYYYPIRRANIATNVDKADIKEELDRVSNASFNKEIVKHARQELAIESVDSRLRRHVTAVCQYAHMSAVVEAFNQIFNFDISGNPNRPVSVRTTMIENGNRDLEAYWKKLIGDAQGVNTKLEGDDVLSWLRSGYAIATLSANPKVWLTQLSSFASASGMLSYSSIMKGFGVAKKEDIQNIGLYCPLADLRRYENTAALAQGVLDKRGVQKGKGSRAVESMRKLGELGMKPIGAVDTFVINRLFGACMIEVQKNGGPKVGDEANKIAAGKLLTKIILETQQNSMATERSAAMRSGNEVLRTATMFSADAMKNIGRFFDAAGEVRVLKARIKNAADPDTKAQYQERLKLAKRKLRKSVAALLLNAAYMAGITVLFKHIFNKWDKEWNEDEERWVTYLRSIGIDFIGNMVGGLPLLRDAYSKLAEGYDIDNYSYSAINDVLDSASSLWKLFNKDTTSEDITSALKKLVYSTSSFTGLPARNVYNLVFGLTKRFSETTAYKIDEIFYKHNYKNDLGKYIEQGDTKMADFMLGLLYDTETTDLADSTMKSLRSLAELGYTVTPREVADTVTVDGEEYAIAPEEQSLIEEQYFSRLSALDRLTSSARYGGLTDEQRADAAKTVHDMTYKKAVSDVMGTEASRSVLIASCVGVENLAVLNAITKGDDVAGSKRKKIVAAINSMPLTLDQKVLLMYAKGYTPKDGEIPGVSAESAKKRLLRSILNARDLTKSQKESLAKACGFTVKNGKISL